MKRLGLGAAVALLLTLLAMTKVPARAVVPFLDDEQLRLSGVSGTVLDGHAARAMVQTPAGFLHLGQVSWRLQLSSLLTFSPRLELRSDWGQQRLSAQARLGSERMSLSEVDARIDAGVLQQFVPADLGGQVSALFDDLVIEQQQVQSANGRLVWQDASWRASTGVRSLGTYVATIESSTAEQLEINVETLAGPLQVAGTATLQGRRYDLDLQLAPAVVGSDPELERALSLVASPSENGYRLRLDGELQP